MRESERVKIAPPPPPTTPRLYLSKESSVLAQELKPLSPRAGALCPGAPASFGAGGCGAWLASAKPGVSVRDNWQITVLQDVHCYRWKDLSSIPFSSHRSLHDSSSQGTSEQTGPWIYRIIWHFNTATGDMFDKY